MSDRARAFIALTGGGTGSLDAKPVAGISDGDIAFGMVNGLYHPYTYDSASALSESSPYVIIPDDNVSGTGAWILGGFQGAMSKVFATTAAGQTISTGSEDVVVFGTEVEDLLDEYNNTTGIFTAKYAGRYLVHAEVCYDLASAWTTSNALWLYLRVDTVKIVATYISSPRTASYRLATIPINIPVTLTVGQTIDIAVLQNSGGDRDLENIATLNYLTIDRII